MTINYSYRWSCQSKLVRWIFFGRLHQSIYLCWPNSSAPTHFENLTLKSGNWDWLLSHFIFFISGSILDSGGPVHLIDSARCILILLLFSNITNYWIVSVRGYSCVKLYSIRNLGFDPYTWAWCVWVFLPIELWVLFWKLIVGVVCLCEFFFLSFFF